MAAPWARQPDVQHPPEARLWLTPRALPFRGAASKTGTHLRPLARGFAAGVGFVRRLEGGQRIHVGAAHEHLEVQVRARRLARRAHEADRGAGVDVLADANRDP